MRLLIAVFLFATTLAKAQPQTAEWVDCDCTVPIVPHIITNIVLSGVGTLPFGGYIIDGNYLPVIGGFSVAPIAPNGQAFWLNGNTNFSFDPTPWIQVVSTFSPAVTNYYLQMFAPGGLQTIMLTTNTFPSVFPFPPVNGTIMNVISNSSGVTNQAQLLFQVQ